MIKGDIKGFFDNVDHHILANLLSKKIKDKNLIDFYWKLVRAGYVNNGNYKVSNLGIPQGGILSPLLANIYLHELDVYMEQLIQKYTVNKPVSKKNKEHTRLFSEITAQSKKKFPDFELIKRMRKELRRIPSTIRDYSTGTRIYYNRYGDDYVIGVVGPKNLAETIQNLVSDFLKNELLIYLNKEKSQITHLTSKSLKYLGYEIFRRNRKYSESQLTYNSKTNTYRKGSNHRVILYAPINDLINKLVDHKFAILNGTQAKPKAITKWIYLEPREIISRYNGILNGIYYYYKGVDNLNQLSYTNWILRFSAVFTLSRKWNISPKKVFKKLGKNLTVKTVNSKGKETSISLALPKTLSINRLFKLDNYLNFDPFKIKYYSVRSHHVWDEPCIICGTNEKVEMHHVNHIRRGKKVGFTGLQSQLNRKQIPVCVNCHDKIHSGKYDGLSLKNLK